MKKSLFFIIALATFFFFTGCQQKQQSSPYTDETDSIADALAADTTIYGRCGDATAMHSLELITDNGDTLYYTREGSDVETDVQGGLSVGDRLAVIAGGYVDGEPFAAKVINLTTLLGKWTSIDKTFDIKEGGAVVSDFQEPKPYTEWKIFNGSLVLSGDTFDIYSLGADSLCLENERGIFAYRRLK